MKVHFSLLAVLVAIAGASSVVEGSLPKPGHLGIPSGSLMRRSGSARAANATLYARGGTHHRRHRDRKQTGDQARRSWPDRPGMLVARDTKGGPNA